MTSSKQRIAMTYTTVANTLACVCLFAYKSVNVLFHDTWNYFLPCQCMITPYAPNLTVLYRWLNIVKIYRTSDNLIKTRSWLTMSAGG